MAAETHSVFGVDADAVRQAASAHFVFDSSTALSPTDLTAIINRAAGKVCGILTARGFDLSEITLSEYPNGFYAIQDAILNECAYRVTKSILGPGNPDLLRVLREDAKESLEAVRLEKADFGQAAEDHEVAPLVMTGSETHSTRYSAQADYVRRNQGEAKW